MGVIGLGWAMLSGLGLAVLSTTALALEPDLAGVLLLASSLLTLLVDGAWSMLFLGSAGLGFLARAEPERVVQSIRLLRWAWWVLVFRVATTMATTVVDALVRLQPWT